MIQGYDTVLYLYCKIVSLCFFFLLFYYYYQLLYNIAALVANKVSYILIAHMLSNSIVNELINFEILEGASH